MSSSRRISIGDKSWKIVILQDTVQLDFCTATWYVVLQTTVIFKTVFEHSLV